MALPKKPSFFVVGLALFSMFFGGGNLIFPLYLGQIAGEHWAVGLLGFLVTSVCLPILGIGAMVFFHGEYPRFFAGLGPRLGFLLMTLLLVVWIPLGSAPRAIALTYTSLGPFVRLPEFWCFSLIYCLCVFFVVRHKYQIINILGYFLTPALLTLLGVVCVMGIGEMGFGDGPLEQGRLVQKGMLEGYNTMDLIASFFFSASVIQLLRVPGDAPSYCLKTLWKASLVAMGLLAVVYGGLVALAATNGTLLSGVAKDQLIAVISLNVLGPKLGVLAALCVVLACFTTAVALTVVFADFLVETLFGGCKRKYPLALSLTLLVTYIMSIFGLEGVTAVTSPVLQVCYPLLIAMIGYFGVREWLLAKKRVVLQSM